ncbi:MAG: signal peptidase II [Actinobacteria bacterium]|nr:MAG: signal peptidase II [Actinomycetota bacterium]
MIDADPAALQTPPISSRAVLMKATRTSLAIAACIVLLDQLSKTWAVKDLDDGHVIHVIWTLQFNLTHNQGMAFSRGTGIGPVIGVIGLVVVVLLLLSLRRADNALTRLATGLIIGGALGNILDRLFRGAGWMRGAVVDFIDFQWWPVFNVADMAIMIGAATMIGAMLKYQSHSSTQHNTGTVNSAE